MGIINGSLNLSALDARLVDALRDTSVPSTMRYTYLQDAYSRIWYKHPWMFTHKTSTITASANVSDYVVDSQVNEIAYIFNQSRNVGAIMNKGINMYFDNYNDDNHGGPLYTVKEIYEDGPETHIAFSEIPSSGTLGDGDVLQIYHCRHIIHIASAGTTATGNMSLNTDYPAFAPQFHPIIVKEALMEAIKNRRDFQEMYQLAKNERDEMLIDMKRHYLTPRRNNVMRTWR
jgi:hypothetical protein